MNFGCRLDIKGRTYAVELSLFAYDFMEGFMRSGYAWFWGKGYMPRGGWMVAYKPAPANSGISTTLQVRHYHPGNKVTTFEMQSPVRSWTTQ